MSERREKIHTEHELPKTRRCELLDVARSSAYYRPEPVSEEDLALMRLIDEIHLQLPFYGSRRTRDELEDRGHTVNRKRVQRLMRQMDLRALYPRRERASRGRGTRSTPTCSGTCSFERANQVWATDICYIPMAKGFMYLVAIMDWHSRRVLSGGCRTPWIRTSVSRRWRRPYSALERRKSSTPTKAPSSPPRRSPACSRTTASPSAWMARAGGWTTCSSSAVAQRQVRGRVPACLRNAGRAPSAGLARYFEFYNTRRRHSALDRRTPDACTSTRLPANWQPETQPRKRGRS